MKYCLFCVVPDLNMIDGSSIWAQTFAIALADTGLVHVDFLAKSTPVREELFRPLHDHLDISVIDGTAIGQNFSPSSTRLGAEEMVERARQLDRDKNYDLVIVRGLKIALGMQKYPDLLSRAWLYLTDIPQDFTKLSRPDRKSLEALAHGSRRLLCQSEGFRRLWRQIAPGLDDQRCTLYTPVVPDPPDKILPLTERKPIAIYAGKFKPAWRTLEMVRSWPGISARVPGANLVMIGDKFHSDRQHPKFARHMRDALECTPDVEWPGALSRQAVQSRIEAAALGLSWRDNSLDETLEYSTKILEYGRAGCPAVINRNLIHEDLLGHDYPLYANSETEFREKVVAGLSDQALSNAAMERLSEVASRHTLSQRTAIIRQWLEQGTNGQDDRAIDIKSQVPDNSANSKSLSNRKVRVLVAGHDFKFFRTLQKKLEDTGRFEFLFDIWSAHNQHDEQESRRLLNYADVILCEWCLGNVKWYSQNKCAGQKLVARLHQQERRRPYLQDSNKEAIDKIIFVSDHIRRDVLGQIDFPEERTLVIPNYIDPGRFFPRKRMAGSEFTLGMIGMVPAMKRLDRALDTLELLRERDSRYRLRVKGALPYDYNWLVNREQEVEYYRDIFERINSGPLRNAVNFDPPDNRVSEWLGLAGFILSPSDFESFHLAVGEGMATGAIPVIWNWEGAEDIWPKHAIVDSPENAADYIHKLRCSEDMEKLMRVSESFAKKHFQDRKIVDLWKISFSN